MPTPIVELLDAVPSSLTTVLVGLSPVISRLRVFIELVSWKRKSAYESWLTLAGWWLTCVLAETSLRYLVPAAVLCLLTISKWATKSPVLITENSLQTTLSDLTTIHSLLPQLPTLRHNIPPKALLRAIGILYIPYLLLTYFVPLYIILGIVGTLILTYRAPFAILLRFHLWQNAYIRHAILGAWATISGIPLPPQIQSLQPTPTSPRPVNSIRFLFTIHENQRWWMGLDWTAALLPGERPSWCSANQEPQAPPNAFNLPPPTSMYLSNPGGGRIKRTGTWRWEEGEWRVIVKKAPGVVSRVERPLPALKEAVDPGAGRLAVLASKMKELKADSDHAAAAAATNASAEDQVVTPEEDGGDGEPLTDADGWIYGDNKWEAPSDKGGLGKYTRHRQWTRVAVIDEVVEIVEDGQIGVQRHTRSSSTISTSSSLTTTTEGHVEVMAIPMVREEGESSSSFALRQRLKGTLSKKD